MQFLISETLNSKVYTPRLEVEINESSINETLEKIDTEGNVVSVVFISELSQESITILNNIIASHNGESYPKEHHTQKVHISESPAFANNITEDGKILYLKIHGMRAIVPAAQMVDYVLVPGEHEFKIANPYGEAFLQGAEIFVDILSMSDMTIKHPSGLILEQYGYDVCMGKVIYKRQAQYAARIPQGIEMSCLCKNTELVDQEMGVNFILHELRDLPDENELNK